MVSGRASGAFALAIGLLVVAGCDGASSLPRVTSARTPGAKSGEPSGDDGRGGPDRPARRDPATGPTGAPEPREGRTGTGAPAGPSTAPADPLAAYIAATRRLAAGGPDALLRVAHLGDSHTSCDALTGRMREVFQERFGDAGHGFVVPGWDESRLHRGVGLGRSGPWQVDRVRYAPALRVGDRLFGLGAASVRSSTSGAAITVQARASLFDVYYLAQPAGGRFAVRVDGGAPEHVSTTSQRARAGFHRLVLPDGEHRLELRVAGDGEVRLFGVQIERPGPGVVYSSLGVGGARVSTPLEWDADLFRAQLQHMRPDLLVVMYGTNDLLAEDYAPDRFAAELARLVGRVREAVPGVSCLVAAPPDGALLDDAGRLGPLPGLPELIAAERAAAEASGCAFWDTLAAMGGVGSIVTWQRERPQLASRDNIHLTTAGYARLADAMSAMLLERCEPQ